LDIDSDTDLDLVVGSAVNQMNDPGQNNSVIEVFYNNALTFTKDSNSVTDDKDYLFNVTFEDIDTSDNTSLTSDILATDIFGEIYHYNKNAMGDYIETVISTSIVNPASIGYYDLDLNGDGLKDIILSSGTNGPGNDLVWFKNNGAGSFSTEEVIDATQNNAFKFTVNDFDNDGDLDVATTAYGDDQVNTFMNQKFVLGVEEDTYLKGRIYPNPTSERLFINSTMAGDLRFSVYDLLGKKLIQGVMTTNRSIDVSELNQGMYLLKIEDISGVYKFIKGQ